VLVAALDAGLCDCVISGIAGVLPELTRFLIHARGMDGYPAAVELLTELIGKLSVFPTPWGLKLIAECRGIATPAILQPLSPIRQQQARDFRAWFAPWWSAREQVLKANP
jgi:4-hydroxy-tetrahydrodipicolinate synthase